MSKAPLYIISLSKTLSWILRYKLVDFKLPLDSEGFCSFHDMLKLPRMSRFKCDDLKTLLDHPSAHERFFIIKDGVYFMARFGKAKDVSNRCRMVPYTPDGVLIYRTSQRIYERIKEQRQIKQLRKKYIYLTPHECDDDHPENTIFIYLNTKKLGGVELFTNDKKIVYTYGVDGHIPWEAVDCVIDKFSDQLLYDENDVEVGATA